MNRYRFVLAASSFRGALRGELQPITHATDATGDRTLCGLECARWTSDEPSVDGPDCLRCMRTWRKLARPSKSA